MKDRNNFNFARKIIYVLAFLLCLGLLLPFVAFAQNNLDTPVSNQVSGDSVNEPGTLSQDQPTSTSEPLAEKIVTDPKSILENSFIKDYGLIIAGSAFGLIFLLIVFTTANKKLKEQKDIKHHTAEPFGNVSSRTTKKARKSNPEAQLIAPGGATISATTADSPQPEVGQEVINKKEMTVKQTDPIPQAEPTPQPPAPKSIPATRPQQPLQPPAAAPPTTPQSNPSADTAQNSPLAQAPPAPEQNEPPKPQIIVGDAIEDD